MVGTTNKREVGTLGERIAEAFLRLKGYRIIARNYRYAGREIDLLARRGQVVVAVEVKLRRGARFGRAVEAVDARKVARIRTALGGAVRGMRERFRARVDLVVIDIDDRQERMTVRHIEAVH